MHVARSTTMPGRLCLTLYAKCKVKEDSNISKLSDIHRLVLFVDYDFTVTDL